MSFIFEVGFRRERDIEMRYALLGACPYMYMGRYCPKEGKNGEKLRFYFLTALNLIVRLVKMVELLFVIRAESTGRRRQRSETRKREASN